MVDMSVKKELPRGMRGFLVREGLRLLVASVILDDHLAGCGSRDNADFAFADLTFIAEDFTGGTSSSDWDTESEFLTSLELRQVFRRKKEIEAPLGFLWHCDRPPSIMKLLRLL